MTLTGVNLGLMYALIAIGLTLIFGVMRIIQYAHGELYMLGAYVLYYWFAVMGWPYWLGVIASAIVIFILGALLQLLLFRLDRRRGGEGGSQQCFRLIAQPSLVLLGIGADPGGLGVRLFCGPGGSGAAISGFGSHDV